MAIFVICCQGDKWQDDLVPIIPNLENLFGAYFKGRNDKDDMIAEAIGFFMVRFSRAWKHGETIRLTTEFTLRDIRKGRKFVTSNPTGGRAALRSVKSFSNKMDMINRFRRKINLTLSDLDFRLLVETLPEREGTAARMATEGYTINEIARHVRCDWRKVRSILSTVAARLT